MKHALVWIRCASFVGLMASFGVRADDEAHGHDQADAYATAAGVAPPAPVRPQVGTPKVGRGRDLQVEAKNNYCGDAVMNKATALLYAAGGVAFAGPQADEKRRQFIETNFHPGFELKITKYRNKRPRYFEVEWPYPGLEKKFHVLRYTLDSPTGTFTGQKEDVIKVEPIDPKTGLPVLSPYPDHKQSALEICRYNAYRCLHPNGCRWQPKETLSESERVKGMRAVKAFADKIQR